jgi:hypothetical protein
MMPIQVFEIGSLSEKLQFMQYFSFSTSQTVFSFDDGALLFDQFEVHVLVCVKSLVRQYSL